MKWLCKAAPHALVILCLMFLVFLILDEFNPMMNFVDNGISRALLGILCVLGVCSAVTQWKDRFAKK